MNDSFRTDVFVRYNPETIACACIYLAARNLQMPLPANPPWYALFNVTEDEIQDICFSILRLFIRAKPNAEKLDSIVNDAKKIQIEAKLKAKGLASQNATPNSLSRPASPGKASPSFSGLPDLKRIKRDDDDRSDSSFGKGLNHLKKKHRSPGSPHRSGSRSRSRTRSRSRSPHSSSRSAASRSHSRSPAHRRKHTYSPSKKHKKDSYHAKIKYTYSKNYTDYKTERKRGRKRHHSPVYSRSRSRSYSKSPIRSKNGNHGKKYKDKYRSRSRSRSTDRHRSKKHNGHHNRSRDSKYRR